MRHARLNVIMEKLEHFKKRDKNFNVGDRIRIRNNKITRKTLFKYSTQVYTITAVIHPKEPWQSTKYRLNDGHVVNGNYLLKIP